MPQGLQIWDANGNLMLDTTSRTGRVIGSIALAASASGSLNVPKLAAERAWATLACSNTHTDPKATLTITNQTTTSATINYTLGPASARLVYGIY